MSSQFYWANLVAQLPNVEIHEEDWGKRTVLLYSKSEVTLSQKFLQAFGEHAVAKITAGHFSYKDPSDDRGDLDYAYVEIRIENVAFPKRP